MFTTCHTCSQDIILALLCTSGFPNNNSHHHLTLITPSRNKELPYCIFYVQAIHFLVTAIIALLLHWAVVTGGVYDRCINREHRVMNVWDTACDNLSPEFVLCWWKWDATYFGHPSTFWWSKVVVIGRAETTSTSRKGGLVDIYIIYQGMPMN